METSLIPRKDKKHYNVSKDEYAIREVIKDRVHLLSYNKLSIYANEKMGRKFGKMISPARIGKIVRKMEMEKDEHFEEVFISGKVAAGESYKELQRLMEEGWKLIAEAYEIGNLIEASEKEMFKAGMNPEQVALGKLKAKQKIVDIKGMAFDKILKAREATDRKLKMAGVYQERAPSDITQSEQMQVIYSAMMTYLQYVLKCPECGTQGGFPIKHFMDYIDAVGKDPEMLNVYMKRNTSKTMAYAQYGDEAKDILDADFNNVEVSKDE